MYDREIKTVFELVGIDENSATKAFGCTLKQCPKFPVELIKRILNVTIDPNQTIISLQEHKSGLGITDIEIRCPGKCHIIFEAKKGWELPTSKQLQSYVPRFINPNISNAIVTVSAASGQYASLYQPTNCHGIPVKHISWSEVHDFCKVLKNKTSSNTEKYWVNEFKKHLGEYMAKDRQSSNLVYLVSLSRKTAGGKNQKHTYVDVVEKDGCYFHQVGNTWPISPPNYIGFRYDGKVQSVHHIESFEVVQDISKINVNWPKTNVNHFVYKLGPAMKPAKELLSERIWTLRVWCTIDSVLSGKFKTVREARDETDKRLGTD